MKKIILFLSVAFFTSTVMAQTVKHEHSIKVIGTAEMEIVPDEIYMSVTLREYTKDKRKFSIEELEKNLVNYLDKTTKTEKKDIKMDNMSAYMISLKRKNKDEVITKSYNVKFKNPQQVAQIYSVMDSLGISGAYVSRYSHSKMDEYKKDIKMKAIIAAKDKAAYLLAAIGEKAGKAINVTERSGLVVVDDGTYDRYRSNTYSQSNTRYSGIDNYSGGVMETDKETTVGDKTIKLHYDIDAEFEIL
jgi:uncharacterized protein YggE